MEPSRPFNVLFLCSGNSARSIIAEALPKYEPTLYPVTRPPRLLNVGPAVYWRPTLPWLVFVAALAAISIVRLTGQSEFLYWQF